MTTNSKRLSNYRATNKTSSKSKAGHVLSAAQRKRFAKKSRGMWKI